MCSERRIRWAVWFAVRYAVRYAVVLVMAVIPVLPAQGFPAATAAPATQRTASGDAMNLMSAQTALIMNGTFEPVITPNWISEVMSELLTPTLGEGYVGTAMTTPAEFWPATGLFSLPFNKSITAGYELLDAEVHRGIEESPRTPLAVFGHSQSAIIASVEKRRLAAEYADRKEVPQVSFVVTGNPYRPNGGFLARLPSVARVLTPWTRMTSTPTDTVFATHDIARQYDMWADFPTYPLNLLASANALFGLMNHSYLPDSVNPLLGNLILTVSLDPGSPNHNPATVVQNYGDTTHYLIPSEHLPLLYPLRWIGLGPLTDVIEPTLKVLVELGYDRTAPYGQVVRAGLFPRIDSGKLAADLAGAFAEGGAALRDLFTPQAAEPTAGALAVSAAARGPRPSLTRRGAGIAKPVRSTQGAAVTVPTTQLPAESRPLPEATLRAERRAPRHSASSKIATARVHPADAA